MLEGSASFKIQMRKKGAYMRACIPALQGLQNEVPRDQEPAGQALHVYDATSR